MTDTATAVLESETANSSDTSDHYYCCNIDLSLCGKDISGLTIATTPDGGEHDCIVCLHLIGQPCGDNCSR
jgi:hypothetical protein